jgi:hypothetical protein
MKFLVEDHRNGVADYRVEDRDKFLRNHPDFLPNPPQFREHLLE